MKRTPDADEARVRDSLLQWYQKTALSSTWSVPVQAANEEEAPWMLAQDLSVQSGAGRLVSQPVSSGKGATREGAIMDKQEADRLVRAIERTHVAWFQVDQIIFNETRNAYELKCSYRGSAGWLGARAIWSTRWITSPREWIDLLTTHREML